MFASLQWFAGWKTASFCIERYADTFIVVAMSLVVMTNLTCLLLLSVSSLMNLEMPKNVHFFVHVRSFI